MIKNNVRSCLYRGFICSHEISDISRISAGITKMTTGMQARREHRYFAIAVTGNTGYTAHIERSEKSKRCEMTFTSNQIRVGNDTTFSDLVTLRG